MTTEKYDIIEDANNIVSEQDDDQFTFTEPATRFVFIGEYWRKKYGKAPFTHIFARAVSEFLKNRDTNRRMDTADIGEFTQQMIKQDSYFKILDYADDIVKLYRFAKNNNFLQPGNGYHKKLKELEEKINQLEQDKSNITSTLQSVKLAYERLKNRIIHDMGEQGEKYIREAITSSDANVWESDIISDSEDDKNE